MGRDKMETLMRCSIDKLVIYIQISPSILCNEQILINICQRHLSLYTLNFWLKGKLSLLAALMLSIQQNTYIIASAKCIDRN